MGTRLPGQTAAWYDRLATLQEGYVYPWRSHLAPWHGEDAYRALVRKHLSPNADVLDVACGHGQDALEIAPHVRSVLGYDRTAAWIELARRAATERGLANAHFICHDSSAEANGGRPRLPAPDASMDLLVCSKGPFHWILEAPRVARPGATLLMLVPDATPLTPWHRLLPEALRWRPAADPHWARAAVEMRLTEAGLTLHSWWSFDVPETFAAPDQLYAWLTWGATPDEVPSFSEVQGTLQAIFDRYAQHAEYAGHSGHAGEAEDAPHGGVAIRRRRYLWKAVVPRMQE